MGVDLVVGGGMMKKDVISEVTVEVKAGLSVDKHTFQVCLNLMQIYAKNNDIKGMVVGFDDRFDESFFKILNTNEEVDKIMHGM